MSKYKNKKPSLIDFTRKYANNEPACEEFFCKANYLQEDVSMYVLNVDIHLVFWLAQSFKIVN